jgi:chaperonin GroES
MNIIPLGDRVVLKKEAEKTQTSSGLFLPSGAMEREAIATIVSVGKKVEDPALTINSKVLYKEYSVIDVTINEEELMVIKEEDIIAVVEEK